MLKAEPSESAAISEFDDDKPSLAQPGEDVKPWFVYPLLAGAITTILLIPAGIHDLLKMTSEERWKMVGQFHLVSAAGLLLGAHFGAWVVCIEDTSLSHALLAASCSPILIAIGTWILQKPISNGELVGTAMAVVGGALISESAGSEKAVSWYGDFMGVTSAVFFVVYLLIGRNLRSWMPIFAYVLPINAFAAISLCCAAVMTEGAEFDRTPQGVFGMYGSWRYLWRSLYLGAVPGIAGHVSIITLLKWVHPLAIALPSTLEPLIGTALGLVFSIGSLPGIFTYLGGSVLIASTVLVIVASYKREKAQANEAAEKGMVSMVDITRGPQDAAERVEGEWDGEEQSLLTAAKR